MLGGNKMAEMKLIPFKVESFQSMTNEIPYGVRQLEAPEIWAEGEKGKGVVVAILDTGVDINHPDLSPNIIGGRNFTREGNSKDFTDRNGHGTHVAGTIAGVENGNGVVGVAPEAKLLIVKVLDGNGSGDYRSIIDGIQYATKWEGENGEKVNIINMSLGGSYDDSKLEKSILEAVSKGILVVVASGNEGNNDEINGENSYELSYPAVYNECITVAACNQNRELANFSNTHLQVDAIASGVKVLSTYPTSQYAVLSGTSMATPHIAGALALLVNIGKKQFKRELTESELFALLTKTCCSLGYEKSSEGNGLPQLTKIFEEC